MYGMVPAMSGSESAPRVCRVARPKSANRGSRRPSIKIFPSFGQQIGEIRRGGLRADNLKGYRPFQQWVVGPVNRAPTGAADLVQIFEMKNLHGPGVFQI
jgi:hypothetical protein